MRTDITDRFFRVYAYQAVDRVPDIEFGYWPQTIRRWLREGMPIDLNEDEQNEHVPVAARPVLRLRDRGVRHRPATRACTRSSRRRRSSAASNP